MAFTRSSAGPAGGWLALALLLVSAGQTCSFSLGSDRSPGPTYRTYYFTQKVDHFGFYEDSVFKQRYLISDTHWKKPGGPILFYTGNEGDITLFCNNTGFMWDVAEELQAMLVFAEHRYYGDSMPFGDLSFSDPKYLNYLTSEQALADFAVLIRFLKESIKGAEDSAVIAIGGSYGGMLAAWFRMKYPHVVDGALASSAPIWQFEDLVPCNTYYQIVTNDFKKSGPGCSESVLNSWAAINRVAETSDGLQWLSNAFHLCAPLKNKDDVGAFKGWLIETWVSLAMVDYPYPANFLEPLPAWPIEVVCKFLKNPKSEERELLENIFQAVNVYYNYTGNAPCLNTSQTASGSLGDLGWSYQACTEMVMPFCSDGVSDMFEPRTWDLQAYSDDCYKQWGVRPRASWITSVYGGKNISSYSNIIFSNGGLDPWSAGGVKESISDSLVAIVIPEGAHHLDLRSNSAYDPRSVLQARALEVQYMKKWIEQHRARNGV
ncbi:lysosomal Pro-X carboxypeptidase isoform X2 [Spea bombifrons]|uniref:lysosomal Pro-X carboxypeptidase isoform X2 n=1 Tax=Spea bombifrons TaxID=233779 RepID=UPI00234ACFB4|nr:lysosomal Pro-X carboxypeptidase isoform X2 [Spea bombifrons]